MEAVMKKTFVKNSTGVLKSVLLCKPEYVHLQPINVISNKWIERGDEIDIDACMREHAEVVATYEENGVTVHFAKTKKELTNEVFARDFGACIAEGYIMGNFREKIRKGESEVYAEALEELSVPCAVKCEKGIFEGGDFWFLDDYTIAIGNIARTDHEGYEDLSKKLYALGYTTVAVPCPEDNLHLDMCFNIAAEKVAVVCEDALPDFFLAMLKKRGFELVRIKQDEVFLHHCNLEALGNGKVMSFESNRRVNEQLRALGLEVIDVGLSEILKMGGGPHCMTFPLERV